MSREAAEGETNSKSEKQPWPERKQERFIDRLLALGWMETIMGGPIFEKNGCRIEVDDFGIWLFEQQDGKWVRTHGLADDAICGEEYQKERILSFTRGEKLVKFRLDTATWTYEN